MKKKLTFLLVAFLASLGMMAQGVEISTVDELKSFRDAVNSGNTYAGQTVKLTADLDLSGESNWKPIGNLVAYPGQSFNGVFDGDGHTISNVKCTDNTPNHAVAGLFGSVVNGTIKDLTVKNVNLNSTHYAGGIVAYTSNGPTIENCRVIGGTISSTPEIVGGSYDNGDKIGGIMGYATAGSTINNCTVQDVTLTAYRDMGGIVGFSAGTVTNNTVIDVNVVQDLTNGYKDPTPTTYGDIIGRNGGATLSNNQVLNSIAKIGDVKYTSIADAVAAANVGDIIEIIKAGSYTLPGISKNVTIEGAVDGVVFNHTSTGSVASIPNGATFKNVTFNFGNENYHGFQHAGTINMEGCTLNGKLFSYGDMNFTNCQFMQTNSDYHMWAYSGDLTYTGCTFTNSATGKFLNIYNESGADKYTVTVNNCTFVNNGSSSKAALNVKATCGDKSLQYDVYINDCTTQGAFPEASKSDALYVLNSLAQVDDRKASVDDRITVTKDGVLIYPSYVAQYNGTKYGTLQAALDAAESDNPANIVIDLLDDASLDITAWNGTKNPLSIGTTDTKSITINGNNHTLTFNQKNSDWNNVATMNDAQTKLILNDMAITNSGYNNGPWNRHDINFDCAVELNNVTSDKALAFKNDVNLNNVTINETGDVYAVWIQPRGQEININGLTVNSGRGIKIDDQYLDTEEQQPSKVTLNIANATFTTTNKAAILLKTAAGADVVAGAGIDISNVAKDSENLVWVDEDSAEEYYKYTTTGATMVPESKETDYVARLSDANGKILGYYKGSDAIATAVSAADTDYTVTIFKAGEYTMPNLPKNITIEGGVDGVVFTHTSAGSVASVPNGATFKNVAFNFGNVNYHGFQHAGTINMEGCTFNGKFFSYGDMNFTGCQFNQTNSDYHMWTYSGNVTYTDCTFTNSVTGKFLNVYNESGATKYTVTVNNCNFVNSSSSANKAALNVKATSGSNVLAYDVYINGCSTDGAFPAESIASALVVLNPLVQVDDRTASGVDNIRVWQDDVQIYPLAPVAKIGEIGYPTLQSAVNAAEAMGGEVTIELLENITGETVTIKENAGLKVTIDGKKDDISNYTVDAIIVVDGLRGNGGSSTNGASVTLQNIAFVDGDYITAQNKSVVQATHYPHHLTIQDCTYSGKDTDTSRDRWFFDASVDGPLYGATVKNVTVENSRLIYANLAEASVFENIIATTGAKVGFNIKTSGTVLIKDCQVTTPKYAFRDYSDAYEGTITLEGNTFISTSTANDEGAIVNRGGADGTAHIYVNSGTYVGAVTVLNGKKVLTLVDGHYSAPIYEDAYADYIVEGKVGKENLYPDDTAAPNGIGDPVYVAQIGDVKYTSLQKAVDAAYEMTGDVTIELIDDIEEYAVVKQKADLNLTIDGAEHTMKGQIVVDGNGRSTGAETLDITNIKFEGNSENFLTSNSFIITPNVKNLPAPFTHNVNNYSHNITISNCSFTSTSSSLDVVAFTSTSGGGNTYNLVMKDNTGTNLHSFAQLTSSTNVTVENCSVEASKSFIGANTANGTYTVSGCTFVSTGAEGGYGVRMKSNSSAELTLTDNNFTADEAIRLGENNASSGNINVQSGRYVGKLVNENTGDGKIILSGGQYSAPVYTSDYEAFIAEGYHGEENMYPEDTAAPHGVTDKVYVAVFDGVKYESLQAALDAAEEANPDDIVIDLLADVSLDITAWDGTKNPLSIGTTDTKSITINGNNHTLTFNQQNSDWNNVATMNDAQTKLILNDMTITNAGKNNGPWNRHDINFNCAVELNNVTSDKALAFKNDATLNNVTVSDTGDIYGVWIQANGQDVSINGLTVTAARGIKIDDQYSDNTTENTNLTISNAIFNTTKKSAVLLKAAGGANVTAGEGINITNAAADTENLVWVDENRAEEYYKYTTTGATMVPETKESDYTVKLSEGDRILGYYKDASDAAAVDKAMTAAQNGQTLTLLKDIDLGANAMNINKGVTVDGDGHSITSTAAAAVEIYGSDDITLTDVAVNATSGRGVQVGNKGIYSGKLTIDEATLTVAKRGINILDLAEGFELNVVNSTIQTNVDDPTTTYTIGEESRGINFSNDPGNYTANITNSTIQGFSYDVNVFSGTQNLTVNMTGGATYGRDVINNWGSNNTFNLNGVDVHGLNNQAGPTEAFACIVDNEGAANNTYALDGCTFTATLSEAAATASGSTASEYLADLRGSNALFKVLGETTYTCNYEEKGGFFQYEEARVPNNKVYFDETAKVTFAESFEHYMIASETDETELYPLVDKVYVAQIGDVKYTSLAKAVAAVPADGTETTITMIDNEMIKVVGYAVTIPATKNIVLDLNGNQIVGTVDQEGTSALIRNLGTLTIKDSSDTNADGTGTGKLMSGASSTWTWDGTDDYSGSYASNLIRNEKDLTVESGYLYNMSSGSAAYAIDNYSAGNVTINGGKVDAAKASAIRMFYVNGGSITVTDGVIGHYVSDDDCTYMGIQVMSGANANVSITGGTISGNYALYANNTGGKIDISGGTFDGYVGFAAAVPDLSISGGAYTCWVGTWGDQTKFVSGGIYAEEDIDEEIIADGYIFTYNTDEATKDEFPYMVRPAAYVAQNVQTETKYETFEAAAAAVADGQTIKLLDNVAMEENITADKSFTVKTEGYEFNPAGHTITIAQTGVTVNVEIPASIINSFASATEGFNVEETVITNGYAYSLKAVENIDFASIPEGYYHIKNLGNSKYVNVLGRRTATVNTSDTDAAKAAGAVIKVKATNGKVEILRSQAIDIPHYAQRAMSYVPGVVRMLVDKLRIDGSGNLLGENGVDAILEKFENSVDPNLYVEEAGNGVRIFGRTPSMQPVLEFYQENKENVDAKLPMLEDKINAAIDRVIKRTGMGSSFKNSFSLHTIWERMGAENLTEPNDEASKLAFLQEVLSSQNHVWNFAFQTATFYMEKVEGSEYYNMMPSEIATYWNRIKQIHPNFKYYIVQTDGKMDIISEGNIDIINNADRAIWQLEPVTEFTLNVPETNWKENEEGTTEYYTTLYTDFGYQLPAGAVAMKVTGVKETTVAAIESDCIGLAETEEIGQQVAPQTPVLIKSDKAGDITLTIGDNYGEVVDEATNLLHGADWLINEYEINSPAVAQLFEIANSISSSASESYDYLDQHEYLQRLNSGTVGNKYFFGLNIGETFANAYKDKTGNEMEETPIRILDMLNGERLVFNESWDDLLANRAFIFSEEFNPIVFSMLYVAENVEKETGYETIDEAFTEVEDGQTIKLLDNVAMAENFIADKSFTLKTEGFTFDPASHTISIAQVGVTVNVEIAASIIDSFASAAEGYTVEETVTANGYAYSLKPVENLDLATIPEGYYHIKNVGNGSYVNVLGRRTALVNLSEEDAAKAAGALIKVKTTNGKVEILRSQAIDIPSYAQRAMRYVPEVVTLLVDKLGVDGSGRILGENGVDAILQKFYDNFDYNLYVENAGDGYRIFGRTPSMQPVLDFYKENKESVDYKLPGLEQAINDAIATVVEKVGRGYSLEGSFSLHTIWERMGAQNLTEPNDDATKLAFLQEVLSSKNHVWNFAYQTATFYAEKVEGHLDQVSEVLEGVDVSKYIELAKKIRPDFKYYIVQKDGKMDIISEGNADIIGNSDIAIWQLEQAEQFTVNVPEENSRFANAIFDENHERLSVEKAYYTTLYTDFGYQLPEGAVALKVKAINQIKIGQVDIEGLGLLVTEEIGRDVAPQTPVLIKSDQPGDIVLTIGDSYGEPVDESTNLLRGVDWLINEYEINTPMLETLYGMAEELSPATAEQYEHLIRRNAGTVNNKYFFGLDIEDLASAYKQKTGNEMEKNPILLLSKKENKKLAFNANEDWGKIGANTAFIFSEDYNPAVFSILGDVNHNGIINIEDVNALVNILKWRDKEDFDYDYDAADVDCNDTFTILDVNTLINIIKFRIPHPDLP